MSSRDDIASRVKRVIAENLCADREKVTDEASLIEDLSADSLDVLEVVMHLEEEFSIEIRDEEAELALTVSDVIKLVTGKVAP